MKKKAKSKAKKNPTHAKAKTSTSKSKSKKSTGLRAKKNSVKKVVAQPVAAEKPVLFNPAALKDPAHSPGHRRMNLKEQFVQSKGIKQQPQIDVLLKTK